ncbi:MAG: NAD(P)-dependent oxidoreductase [bacterium]|nr:NAD(P)-dependent oxidoreductase [bacterium]
MPETQDLDLAERRVLVTGASGFIGAHLCRALASAGVRLHATSRHSRPGSEALTWHRIDLGDAGEVDKLVGAVRPEIVFHLASYVAGARSVELVPLTFHANLASTVHLLTALTQQGGLRRFVQVGSLEEPEPGEPLAVPSSPYAAAKMSASGYARMFHALYDTPVVLARLFMVYGPAQNDLKKLIPYLILSLLEGRPPKLSSGTREVDWIYVDDVVDGLMRAAARNSLGGRRVDLGSGRLVTIRGVVEELYRQLAPGEAAPFGSLEDRPMEQVRRARMADTEALLGWRPGTSLEDGLRATIAWYRQELEAGRLDTGGG